MMSKRDVLWHGHGLRHNDDIDLTIECVQCGASETLP
jgi:hypothetical protein